jgi:hypothetical protein
VVALGITLDGTEVPLALAEGVTDTRSFSAASSIVCPEGTRDPGGGGEARGVIAGVRKLASASRWESGPGSCQGAR